MYIKDCDFVHERSRNERCMKCHFVCPPVPVITFSRAKHRTGPVLMNTFSSGAPQFQFIKPQRRRRIVFPCIWRLLPGTTYSESFKAECAHSAHACSHINYKIVARICGRRGRFSLHAFAKNLCSFWNTKLQLSKSPYKHINYIRHSNCLTIA